MAVACWSNLREPWSLTGSFLQEPIRSMALKLPRDTSWVRNLARAMQSISNLESRKNDEIAVAIWIGGRPL